MDVYCQARKRNHNYFETEATEKKIIFSRDVMLENWSDKIERSDVLQDVLSHLNLVTVGIIFQIKSTHLGRVECLWISIALIQNILLLL